MITTIWWYGVHQLRPPIITGATAWVPPMAPLATCRHDTAARCHAAMPIKHQSCVAAPGEPVGLPCNAVIPPKPRERDAVGKARRGTLTPPRRPEASSACRRARLCVKARLKRGRQLEKPAESEPHTWKRPRLPGKGPILSSSSAALLSVVVTCCLSLEKTAPLRQKGLYFSACWCSCATHRCALTACLLACTYYCVHAASMLSASCLAEREKHLRPASLPGDSTIGSGCDACIHSQWRA